MKQSKLMSLVESVLNIAIGFGISLTAQWVFLPLLGVQISLAQNFQFALIMTAISVARSYLLRRLFEALHIRVPMPASVLAIAAERRRQIEAEGWTPDHDDEHALGDLALAGGCYAMTPFQREQGIGTRAMARWPWALDWWKPQDNRRDLIRAGALIVAELDKMDRKRKQRSPAPSVRPAGSPRDLTHTARPRREEKVGHAPADVDARNYDALGYGWLQ